MVAFVEILSSLKNEFIQEAKNLKSLKGRKINQKVLIEGQESILWGLKFGVFIEYIITSLDDITEIIDKFENQVKTFKTTEGLMKKITDTRYLIPVVAVAYTEKKFQTDDFIIILDDVKDYGNIGTIIRTANAFGIKNILSTRKDFDIYYKKTIEASRGTVFNTGFNCCDSPKNTLNYLRKNNYQIITTTPYGRELQSLINISQKPIALVIGNETNGASDTFIKNSDATIQIPMNPNVESLNVGVATGISVYELKLKQVIKMIDNRIKSTLGRELNVASMLIREALDRELKKISFLSSCQLVFMMVLKCDEKMTKDDIQKQFGILEHEFAHFLTPLIKHGLVENISNDNYCITLKGIEIMSKLWNVVENTESKILNCFSDEEKNVLFSMLNRIKKNCINLK